MITNCFEIIKFNEVDKKYVRVFKENIIVKINLSTGELAQNGKIYWIEVTPLEWLVDLSLI